MNLAIALLLTTFAFAFIVSPFFRRRLQRSVSDTDDRSKELSDKRDVAFAMLKELEFDYQSGVLSEEDYRALETKYKKKAISILKDADEAAKADVTESEIEAVVLKLRSKASKNEPKSRKQPNTPVQPKHFCPHCGTETGAIDRFCARCGKALK